MKLAKYTMECIDTLHTESMRGFSFGRERKRTTAFVQPDDIPYLFHVSALIILDRLQNARSLDRQS